MRVFLCSFAGFSVAIPASAVSSLMLYTNKAAQTVEYNPQNNNTFVALPLLFRRPLASIRHGIILKNGHDEECNDTVENKIILLTTEVECETEIQPEEIYPLPKAFNVFRFSALFSGILFDSHLRKKRAVSDAQGRDNPVLLLNPEQLVQNIKTKPPVTGSCIA